MARRNLLAEAQIQAAAQVAPQVAALSEALQTARADRNSAISAAATAYHGLSGAIHRAGPQTRKIYSGAAKGAAGTDAIAKTTLGGLASSPGVDTIKAAYAHEGAVGGAVLSKALASRLADLSDKRIAAAAGRAFQVGKASSDYSAAAATNAQKRQNVAAQQGLFTGSAYSKLTEAQAGRDFQAAQQRSQQAFTAGQNLLGRKNDRLNSARSLKASQLQHEGDQSFQARQNALSRRQTALGRRESARQFNAAQDAAASGDGPKPTADTTYKGRQAIQAWTQKYQAAGPGKMHTIVKQANDQNLPRPILEAASQRATGKPIPPKLERDLRDLGIIVPQEWTGVPVKPHVRKSPRR